MKILHQAHYDFTFYEEGGKLFLSVVCGTTAVFDITFPLHAKELQSYEAEGNSFIESLVYRVRDFPDEYANRR